MGKAAAAVRVSEILLSAKKLCSESAASLLQNAASNPW